MFYKNPTQRASDCRKQSAATDALPRFSVAARASRLCKQSHDGTSGSGCRLCNHGVRKEANSGPLKKVGFASSGVRVSRESRCSDGARWAFFIGLIGDCTEARGPQLAVAAAHRSGKRAARRSAEGPNPTPGAAAGEASKAVTAKSSRCTSPRPDKTKWTCIAPDRAATR